jgi:hypothetical protein
MCAQIIKTLLHVNLNLNLLQISHNTVLYFFKSEHALRVYNNFIILRFFVTHEKSCEVFLVSITKFLLAINLA